MMTDDDISRAIPSEPIEPSPEFQARVMRQIRRQAETRPSIPFPWRRALLIPLALGAALVAPLVRPEIATEGPAAITWLWCLAAVAASVGAVLLPLRFLRPRP